MSDTAAEPLISSHDSNHDADFDRDDDARRSEEEGGDVDESQLVRPGAFIWALTLCAGISGLLFGYEYVALNNPVTEAVNSDLRTVTARTGRVLATLFCCCYFRLSLRRERVPLFAMYLYN